MLSASSAHVQRARKSKAPADCGPKSLEAVVDAVTADGKGNYLLEIIQRAHLLLARTLKPLA